MFTLLYRILCHTRHQKHKSNMLLRNIIMTRSWIKTHSLNAPLKTELSRVDQQSLVWPPWCYVMLCFLLVCQWISEGMSGLWHGMGWNGWVYFKGGPPLTTHKSKLSTIHTVLYVFRIEQSTHAYYTVQYHGLQRRLSKTEMWARRVYISK